MDLGGLIPSFGNILLTLGAFVIALSIIVAIHEYGHYIVGRWSGIKADVFSIGFGPVLLRRTDKRGTQWQFAAIPLGGYVKFAGDANAASAPAEGALAEMSPREARMTMQGAPLWARAATVAAGPIFNFILSIIVFCGLILYQGVPKDPLTIDEIADLPFTPMELQPGDEIVAIAGKETPDVREFFGEFIDGLPEEQILTYTVRRDGAIVEAQAPHPRPTLVQGVEPQSAALAAGIEVGDVVTEIDGRPVVLFEELRDAVGSSEGRTLDLKVWRDGEVLDIALAPKRQDIPSRDGGFETRWLLGITASTFFDQQSEPVGIGEAVTAASQQTLNVATTSLSMFYNVIAGELAACNIRGPVTIAKVSRDTIGMGWERFIGFIAILSTAVGLLNLFPIPVLDGGHLVFHAWEAVTGRPPSDKALRVLMAAGLTILLAFMVFALTNDFFCP